MSSELSAVDLHASEFGLITPLSKRSNSLPANCYTASLSYSLAMKYIHTICDTHNKLKLWYIGLHHSLHNIDNKLCAQHSTLLHMLRFSCFAMSSLITRGLEFKRRYWWMHEL